MMKKYSIIGIVIQIALISVMLFSLGIACFNTFHSVRSTSWPTAKGLVLESRVESKSSDSSKSTSHVRIQYQYSVNGSEYTGTRAQFAMFGSKSGSTAQRLTSKFPKGLAIDVHYAPNKPSRSVLEPGFRMTILLQYLFAAIFGFIGILVPMWCKEGENTEQTDSGN